MLPRNTWTKETCKETAKKYNRIVDWQNDYKGSYLAAYRRGWLQECTSHMETKERDNTNKSGRKVKWDLENCKKDAKLFNGRYEWQLSSSSAYYAARKNGWLDICCKHMKRPENKHK